jgi:hypothetical protein
VCVLVRQVHFVKKVQNYICVCLKLGDTCILVLTYKSTMCYIYMSKNYFLKEGIFNGKENNSSGTVTLPNYLKILMLIFCIMELNWNKMSIRLYLLYLNM